MNTLEEFFAWMMSRQATLTTHIDFATRSTHFYLSCPEHCGGTMLAHHQVDDREIVLSHGHLCYQFLHDMADQIDGKLLSPKTLPISITLPQSLHKYLDAPLPTHEVPKVPEPPPE